jgi:hypothetical protein
MRCRGYWFNLDEGIADGAGVLPAPNLERFYLEAIPEDAEAPKSLETALGDETEPLTLGVLRLVDEDPLTELEAEGDMALASTSASKLLLMWPGVMPSCPGEVPACPGGRPPCPGFELDRPGEVPSLPGAFTFASISVEDAIGPAPALLLKLPEPSPLLPTDESKEVEAGPEVEMSADVPDDPTPTDPDAPTEPEPAEAPALNA